MKHFWSSLPGWFTFPDFYAYIAERAKVESWKRMVEIGCYAGQSAAFLGVELLNRDWSGKLDLVDRFDYPIDQVRKNLDPILPILGELHRGDSWGMATRYPDASLDFIFIDADHGYDSVKKDLNAWRPKIRPGGVISGHDYCPLDERGMKFGVIEAVIEAFGTPTRVWPGRNDLGDGPMIGRFWPCWEVQL